MYQIKLVESLHGKGLSSSVVSTGERYNRPSLNGSMNYCPTSIPSVIPVSGSENYHSMLQCRSSENMLREGQIIAAKFKVINKFSASGKVPCMYTAVTVDQDYSCPVPKNVIVKAAHMNDVKKHQRLAREISILKHLWDDPSNRCDFIQKFTEECHSMDRNGLFLMLISEAKGDDLHTLANKFGIFDVSSTLHIAQSMLAAIAFIHRNGILHRDIKPSNICAGRAEFKDFGIYLIDFDLANNYLTNNDFGHAQHYPFEEKKSHRIGNPNYRSRAMHKGQRAGRRDDLECLGFTLLRFVIGKLPWEKEDSIGPVFGCDDIMRDTKKCEMKQSLIDDLYSKSGECQGVDDLWLKFFNHVDALQFAQDPQIDGVNNMINIHIKQKGIKIKPKHLQIFSKAPERGSSGDHVKNTALLNGIGKKQRPTIDSPTWGERLFREQVEMNGGVRKDAVQAQLSVLMEFPSAGDAQSTSSSVNHIQPPPFYCHPLSIALPSFSRANTNNINFPSVTNNISLSPSSSSFVTNHSNSVLQPIFPCSSGNTGRFFMKPYETPPRFTTTGQVTFSPPSASSSAPQPLLQIKRSPTQLPQYPNGMGRGRLAEVAVKSSNREAEVTPTKTFHLFDPSAFDYGSKIFKSEAQRMKWTNKKLKKEAKEKRKKEVEELKKLLPSKAFGRGIKPDKGTSYDPAIKNKVDYQSWAQAHRRTCF